VTTNGSGEISFLTMIHSSSCFLNKDIRFLCVCPGIAALSPNVLVWFRNVRWYYEINSGLGPGKMDHDECIVRCCIDL